MLETSHHLKIFLILSFTNVHTLPFTTLFIFWLKSRPAVRHHLNWGSLILWVNSTGQLTPLLANFEGINGIVLFVQSPNGIGGTLVAWEATLVPHRDCFELIFLFATTLDLLSSLFSFKPLMSLIIFSVLATLMIQSFTLLPVDASLDCLEDGVALLSGFLHHSAYARVEPEIIVTDFLTPRTESMWNHSPNCWSSFLKLPLAWSHNSHSLLPCVTQPHQ